MLCEITIENIAVIEKASAEFGSGFNVLTGETGAGKSILIDSINAILGNRTSRDIVRSGAAKAKIWARFSDVSKEILNKLDEIGYPIEEELLLYREISAEGKSNCRINGTPATAAILRDICGGLINIHGQHDNQSLLNPIQHVYILDSFAGNSELLSIYKNEYSQLLKLRKEMQSLSMNDDEKTRKIELLQFKINEIEDADFKEDEEKSLISRRNLVQNSQDIVGYLNKSYIILSGGDDEQGAAIMLSEAASAMEDAAEHDTALAEFAATLNEMYYSASEIASDLQSRLDNYEFNPNELDMLELRIDLIYKLKIKYGAENLQNLLQQCSDAQEELDGIEFSASRLSKLKELYSQQKLKVKQFAENITKTRLEAFARLNKEISSALHFLNMPEILLTLHHQKVDYGINGQDELEFYISTNPGELPKPLSKIASGGELSRIMLALKSALADRDELATVIYDEIDTGISGLAAGRIGQLLRKSSQGRQVICVTHTAQVAASAMNHLIIVKNVEGGRTFTKISKLNASERIDELARIISGDNVTELSRANAQEMIELSEKPVDLN